MAEKLIDAGFDTWWVGGAVRDMALGVIPKDIDIATEATPDQIAKVFPKLDATTAVLGSVRVTQKGHTFEVTTFREDDGGVCNHHLLSVTCATSGIRVRR